MEITPCIEGRIGYNTCMRNKQAIIKVYEVCTEVHDWLKEEELMGWEHDRPGMAEAALSIMYKTCKAIDIDGEYGGDQEIQGESYSKLYKEAVEWTSLVECPEKKAKLLEQTLEEYDHIVYTKVKALMQDIYTLILTPNGHNSKCHQGSSLSCH